MFSKVLIISLSASSCVCITFVITHTNSSCKDDPTAFGCDVSFDIINYLLAIIMLCFDSVLFALFCYKMYLIISKLDKRTKKVALGRLKVEFMIVMIAIISCIVMVTINFVWMEYKTLITMAIDCAVLSTCNTFMMDEIRHRFSCAHDNGGHIARHSVIDDKELELPGVSKLKRIHTHSTGDTDTEQSEK